MCFFDNKTAPKILDEISDNDRNNKKPLYLRDLQKHETKIEEKMNEKQKIIKYVDNSFQKHKRYPPSNSLYKELMNKKNEIYDNFMQRLESGQDNIAPYIPSPISFPTGINDEEEKIKKVKNENLNGYSVLFSKKKNDGKIPITFPLICSNMIDCDSISQRARYENIMEAFIKLKSMIENDKNQGKFNERQYIIEFVSNKNIDKENLTEEGNDIYLCYLIMWSLTLWYTDEFERESRFLQMIEVIEKVQVHDIQIFELLFKALVDIKWSDKDIILLYLFASYLL